MEKLQWYAMRWKIEVFHKILKSGCRAEQARLRTAERLVRLLAVFCILSWRVFWLTMLNRIKPDLEPALVLTGLETNILDRLIPDPTADPSPTRTLSLYLTKIARLGGYLSRAKDPPPGNIVMWRGLSRLTDIAEACSLESSKPSMGPLTRTFHPRFGAGLATLLLSKTPRWRNSEQQPFTNQQDRG